MTCTTKRWRADTVETSVLLRLMRLSEDKKQLAQAIEYSEELLQSELHSIPIEIDKGKRRIEVLKSERDRLHRSLLHLEPTSLPQSVLSDIKNRDHEIEDEEERLLLLQQELDELSIKNKNLDGLIESLQSLKPTLKGFVA